MRPFFCVLKKPKEQITIHFLDKKGQLSKCKLFEKKADARKLGISGEWGVFLKKSLPASKNP